MTDHYYTNKPSVQSDEQKWTYELKGYSFTFTTDRGVFSKNEVDFGSRLLIDSFVDPDIAGPILDVGCGYGPIGLTVARLNEARLVHMVDVNERAIGLCKQNAEQNQIDNVEIYPSDGFGNVKQEHFAAILTNPPIRAGKKVVHDILEQAYQYLAQDGSLWVVIQKKQGAPSAVKKLETLFGSVETVQKKKGYSILFAKKID